MRKVILLGLMLILVSCKKKYNCRCSTTILYTNGQEYYVSRNSPMTEKMTEKQATSVCAHEADNINATYLNLFTNNGTTSTAGTRFSTGCNLQ